MTHREYMAREYRVAKAYLRSLRNSENKSWLRVYSERQKYYEYHCKQARWIIKECGSADSFRKNGGK